MGRLTGWNAFISRWKMFAEAVSSIAQSAQQAGSTQLSQLEAAKLDIVLKKAVRARQILQQLQEASDKQAALELQHRPTLQRLPALLEQLKPEELSQAAEFAALEGMRAPLLQVLGGSSSPAATAGSARLSDPFGIRVAFRPGHPLALLTWQQYVAIVGRMSRAVEQQLQGPALGALVAFNAQRRQLVAELQALRQQLEPEVDIPQLQPLRDETERLDELLAALAQLQDAHRAMLCKDLGRLDLQLLGQKLRLRAGSAGGEAAWEGSELQAALQRLSSLHARVVGGERLPPASITQLDADLRTLAVHAASQQRLQQAVEVNIQRHEAAMFNRLRQLRSTNTTSTSTATG